MNKALLPFVFFALLNYSYQTRAQTTPFWNEIREFKKQDSISAPPQNAILFVGSSSFRIWNTIHQDFSGYKIINRGFGGSSIPDVTRYAGDIITPYHPRQVVIYCGDNDLASSYGVTPEIVLERFQRLFKIIRQDNERAGIIFVSIKPSPSRKYLMPNIVKTNALIESFLEHENNTAYVNVYDSMLNDKGEPMPELFLVDMLHMNAKGYEIWKKALTPYLRK
jgi:lysophospholipase L1-like esterase